MFEERQVGNRSLEHLNDVVEEEIVANAESWEDYENGRIGYFLRYGSKQLLLICDVVENYFVTYVETIKDQSDKLNNETTALYIAARQFMQKIADERRNNYRYGLSTSNPRMIRWANTQGKKIFGWTGPVKRSVPSTEEKVYRTNIQYKNN